VSARSCQDCGTIMGLLETSHGGETTFRKMVCECGSRFESEERITRRLPPALARTRRQPPAGTEAPPQPPTVANPPASVGGDRGGVSEVPIPSESDPNPKASVLSEPRARPRRNRDAEYTADFERLWEGCDRWGHKEPAARAYVERGRPDVDSVIGAWKSYRASLPSWRNPKDVSAWLRIKGHLQTYQPAPPELPRNGAKQAVPFAVAAEESRTDRHLDNLAEAILDD
jgi:hypothetical protein